MLARPDRGACPDELAHPRTDWKFEPNVSRFSFPPDCAHITDRRLRMAQDNKKFGLGMVLGLAVGMLLYRLFLA